VSYSVRAQAELSDTSHNAKGEAGCGVQKRRSRGDTIPTQAAVVGPARTMLLQYESPTMLPGAAPRSP